MKEYSEDVVSNLKDVLGKKDNEAFSELNVIIKFKLNKNELLGY
jgi:hypothetical protein